MKYKKWATWAVINLFIVSAAGVLLRYKILFALPAVDHKNLLHAHSHFAFSGWISLALFTALTVIITRHANVKANRYSRLFYLSLFAAYGMLVTFPFMGYKAPSIGFSTLSIIFSYLFAVIAWRDLNKTDLPVFITRWFKAALAFYVISSLGAFHLAWLMATRTGSQPLYIGSVYFFLHFQYNGWFLFCILGLFIYQLHQFSLPLPAKKIGIVFRLLFVACFPAFLLCTLWMRLPVWLYWIAVGAAACQVAGLIIFCRMAWPLIKGIRLLLSPVTKWLWALAGIALLIKFLLQTLSTIPSLSYLAFGFRPIVIGYLHLILLGFVTFFLLGYLVQEKLIVNLSKVAVRGLTLFVCGVILNELFLMVQGIGAIGYSSIPAINHLLLGAAILMFSGLAIFSLSQLKSPALKLPLQQPVINLHPE